MNIVMNAEYLYKVAPWLTWDEISDGLNRNLISNKVVVDYALLRLNENSSADEYEIAMLSIDELDQVHSLIRKLVSNGDGPENFIDTWLYLYISWLYEHRNEFDDPLALIEVIYADFEYPQDIASMVRYMPLPNGEIGGDDYLYKNWEKIISLYKKRLEEKHDNCNR